MDSHQRGRVREGKSVVDRAHGRRPDRHRLDPLPRLRRCQDRLACRRRDRDRRRDRAAAKTRARRMPARALVLSMPGMVTRRRLARRRNTSFMMRTRPGRTERLAARREHEQRCGDHAQDPGRNRSLDHAPNLISGATRGNCLSTPAASRHWSVAMGRTPPTSSPASICDTHP
jgi:hypothetical protein